MFPAISSNKASNQITWSSPLITLHIHPLTGPSLVRLACRVDQQTTILQSGKNLCCDRPSANRIQNFRILGLDRLMP